jgi:hypothetical protein
MRKSKLKHVLSTLTLTGVLLGTVVTPAMAATGDFYDTTSMVHYTATEAGLDGTIKSDLVAAYSKGDAFIKEQASGKFLDYNGAYAEFSSLILAGHSASDAIKIVATDTTLQKTIDTSTFTDASSGIITSASVINNTITITLGRSSNEPYVPPVKPNIDDFEITASDVTITPTISTSYSGAVITLSVPSAQANQPTEYCNAPACQDTILKILR